MKQPMNFGNYALLDRVSIGGMAEVYRAKRASGGNQVLAIKRILPALVEDVEFTKMFIDEATIAGQLDHPNIAKIIELGEQDGTLFIAMEYVWGKDLLQIVNRFRKLRQPMPIEMACYVLMRMLDGLDYAHRQRDQAGQPMEIVHRDCSPQNVLVAYNGDVKVIDFGIAKAASRASQTVAGVLKGKFSYMAPEQVRGEALDRRTDIFACGTVLYELLISDRLFTGASDLDILEKVREVKIPMPSKADPRIDSKLEAIIMRALHKDAEQRFQWCSEYRAALEGYLREKALVFTAADMSAWLRKAFAQEIEKELQDIGALRSASGHMEVPAPVAAVATAAAGLDLDGATVASLPPEGAVMDDLDGATVFNPGAVEVARAASAADAAQATPPVAAPLAPSLDDETRAVFDSPAVAAFANTSSTTPAEASDPLDEINTGAVARLVPFPAAQTAQPVAMTAAAMDDDATAFMPNVPPVGGKLPPAPRPVASAEAIAIYGADAAAESDPLDSQPTGATGDASATGETGRSGRQRQIDHTGQTGQTGQTGPSSRGRPSMDPVRRSTRLSTTEGLGKEPTASGARAAPRTSREMRAATAAGVRKRSQGVSLGLSHEELFGDAVEPEASTSAPVATPSPPPAVLPPSAEISGVMAAGPIAATPRATTSMGTAMPAKEGTPTAVIAAAVAGGLVFVAVAFYWFVIRDANPVASAPSAQVVEVKGRVLIQTKELDPAEVYIDGMRRGTTAKGELVVLLPMGAHEVRVMIGERQLCAETVQVVDPAKLAAVLCYAPAAPTPTPTPDAAVTPL